MEINAVFLVDLFATFAAAVSGIRLASNKDFDLLGAYIIGFITAIGGGTTRDLLLGLTPFWMKNPQYIITTGIAILTILVFKKKILNLGKTLFLFDTIGLGLFTMVGLLKSLDAGFPFWVCIIMGTITGSLGGVLRDIILNEVPLLFRKDLYATACIFGGLVYFVVIKSPLDSKLAGPLGSASIIAIRLLAVRFKWGLPKIKL